MAESDCSSSAPFVTSSSGDLHSQPHSSRNLIQNGHHPDPTSETLNPEISIPPSALSDTLSTSLQPLPIMAFPKAGTLAYFMLERSFAVAMNTPLECNINEREIIESVHSGEVQFSAGNKSVIGSDGRNSVTVEETPGGSGSKDELIPHPSQTGEVASCISESSECTGSEERPWVLASEGPEASPRELARGLNCLHDERVKQRTARKGV